VDVENFSDVVAEVRKEVMALVAAVTVDLVADPQPSDHEDKASPEFVKELEMTVHREGVLCRMHHLSRLMKIFPKTKTLLPR
jgi:hypothetical protein